MARPLFINLSPKDKEYYLLKEYEKKTKANESIIKYKRMQKENEKTKRKGREGIKGLKKRR